MHKKTGTVLLLLLNILGLVCLIYYAAPYLTHDLTVPNPEAMLPLQRWDACGMVLTLGLLPLTAVNILAFVCVKTIKKPLRFLFLVPCVLCLLITAHYWASDLWEGGGPAAALPVVRVKLKFRETGEIRYGLLYDDGGLETLDEAFSSEGTELWIADKDNFRSRIENGRVKNTLVRSVLNDPQGNAAAEDTVKALLQTLAAAVNHEITEVKIFRIDQNYFAAVKTNVNWQSPCCFYQYLPAEGKLLNLFCWEDMDVLDVSLPIKS